MPGSQPSVIVGQQSSNGEHPEGAPGHFRVPHTSKQLGGGRMSGSQQRRMHKSRGGASLPNVGELRKTAHQQGNIRIDLESTGNLNALVIIITIKTNTSSLMLIHGMNNRNWISNVCFPEKQCTNSNAEVLAYLEQQRATQSLMQQPQSCPAQQPHIPSPNLLGLQQTLCAAFLIALTGPPQAQPIASCEM